MKLLIEIPAEFEAHFRADRFNDSLHRLRADAHLLAGLYEQETALMLVKALQSAVIVPPHRRLINADALVADMACFDGEDWHYGYTTTQIKCAPSIILEDEKL